MDTAIWQAVGAALFFLFIFLAGFWLSRSGKPYNGLVFNVHKLLALAAVILLVITLYRANGTAPLGAAEWAAGVVTVLGALSLFVTGALVSIDRPMPAIVRLLHHVVPYLALLSTAATLYLVLGR